MPRKQKGTRIPFVTPCLNLAAKLLHVVPTIDLSSKAFASQLNHLKKSSPK